MASASAGSFRISGGIWLSVRAGRRGAVAVWNVLSFHALTACGGQDTGQ